MSLRKQLLAVLALIACSRAAEAQVSRVFVSVVGNDANTCSNIATPCRTLAGGIAQVDAHGEVIVIDSGSYAGGTITKSVKINVPPGVVAYSGLPITANPGVSGIVVLRGLTLKALTVGSGTAITHQSGTLFVENTVVDGWENGLISLASAGNFFVKGSVFRNAYEGVVVDLGSTSHVVIDASSFENIGDVALYFLGGKGKVSDSRMSVGYAAATTYAGAEVTFHRCEVSGFELGVLSEGGITRISQSTITRSTYGIRNYSGTFESFGNNVVRGNTFDSTGTITPVGLQ